MSLPTQEKVTRRSFDVPLVVTTAVPIMCSKWQSYSVRPIAQPAQAHRNVEGGPTGLNEARVAALKHRLAQLQPRRVNERNGAGGERQRAAAVGDVVVKGAAFDECNSMRINKNRTAVARWERAKAIEGEVTTRGVEGGGEGDKNGAAVAARAIGSEVREFRQGGTP